MDMVLPLPSIVGQWATLSDLKGDKTKNFT
jgi:hypothetical protein